MSDPASTITVHFAVKFGKETVELTLPLTATVADVKAHLSTVTGVQADKQRLLLNAPVEKDKRRDPADACPLRDLFGEAYLATFIAHTASTGAAAGGANAPPPRVRVTAMLIGSSRPTPMVDSKAAAEISRLVSTTVEHDGLWYRCCYGKGYLRQTAYVCRTCITEGRADPAHSICLACAEMCHGTHEVEEWGVRYCMRCDCCTRKCWRTPPAGYPRAPRTTDAGAGGVNTAAVIDSGDIAARVEPRRRRSRSTSPTAPKRATTGSGGSPVSGVRVAAVAAAPSPFSLQDQPACETTAVCAPVTGPRPAPQPRRASPPSPPGRVATAESVFPSDPAGENSVVRPVSQEESTAASRARGSGAVSRVPLAEANRCMFVIDSSTGKPPCSAVLPVNARNRYPRAPLSWCYCADDHPTDDPECGGIVCMLCTSCFWSTHMTRLYTEQLRRVPCYGDVVQGDTLAFKCTDCNTYVCPPCRLRCHRNHTVEPGFTEPSREDGTDNGAPPGVNFSCGCRGLCSIAEVVPEDEVDDPNAYMPMPADMATHLMDNDVFTGFICAHCMQENPWLMTDDPAKCYNGVLPPKVTGAAIKPIIPCGQKEAPAGEDAVEFPWHGMLLPVSAFSEDATCGCAPCRAAFDIFAPRATEDAREMMVELHDECDNCGVSLKGQTAFMCKTCEMNMDNAFMICHDCNNLRVSLVNARAASNGSGGSADPATTTEAPPATAEDGASRPYKHSLDHEFLADTDDNVYALAGMQMMRTMDTDTLSYLQENWDELKGRIEVSSSLVESFGQVPLSFTAEELETMVEDNRKSTGSSVGKGTDESPQKKPKHE